MTIPKIPSVELSSSSSPKKPPFLPHQYSISKLPKIFLKDQYDHEVRILAYLFELMKERQDPTTAKGHFAVLMKSSLYQDLMMKVFFQSLQADEQRLLDKYQSLDRAREKYAKALSKDSRIDRDRSAFKYWNRRKEFKKFAKAISTDLKTKYGIDISSQLKVPKDWVKKTQGFGLSEGILKRELVKVVPEKLLKSKDYEICKTVDCIGGKRSPEADFYEKVDTAFKAYYDQKFPSDACENLDDLTSDLRHLYLAKKMGDCSAILMTVTAVVHFAIKNLSSSPNKKQELVTQASQIVQGRDGSWLKLVKKIDPEKEEALTPRGMSLAPFNHEDYEKPLNNLPQVDRNLTEGIHEFGKTYRVAMQQLLDGIKQITTIYAINETKPNHDDFTRLKFIQDLSLTQLMFMDRHIPTLRHAFEEKS